MFLLCLPCLFFVYVWVWFEAREDTVPKEQPVIAWLELTHFEQTGSNSFDQSFSPVLSSHHLNIIFFETYLT